MKKGTPFLTVSARPGGVIFLLLSCGCFCLPRLPLFRDLNYYGGVVALFCLCGLVFLTGAVVYGKSYAFSDDGIEHRLFGVRFRRTAWTDVVSVVRIRTSERSGTSVGFLFTKAPGTPPSPDDLAPAGRTPIELCFRKKGFWREWLIGKHVFLQQFPQKQEDAVLSVFSKYYGALDYDVRQPPTQAR